MFQSTTTKLHIQLKNKQNYEIIGSESQQDSENDLGLIVDHALKLCWQYGEEI